MRKLQISDKNGANKKKKDLLSRSAKKRFGYDVFKVGR